MEQLEVENRRWALWEADRVFCGEKKAPPPWLRERRADELWMMSTIDITHVLHVQTNLSQETLRLYQLNPRRAIERMGAAGYRRLEKLDLFLNIRIVLREARRSPFRLQWFAYMEVSSGSLHYHIVLGVDPAVRDRFESMVTGLMAQFEADPRSKGCSLVLHPYNNPRKQRKYVLKRIDNDLMYDNRVFWTQFVRDPPTLVRKGSKWVRADLNPRPKHWPVDWTQRIEQSKAR
jgi:hypothetical protein